MLLKIYVSIVWEINDSWFLTIASLVACWQPLSVLCFLCSPVNKSTVNHPHNTINNLKYYLHLEHFASMPTSSEWYTYFEQIAAIAPIRNWTLTLNTFHPCPQLRMAHLHRTICCHSPNIDFNPYFEHFASTAAAWNLIYPYYKLPIYRMRFKKPIDQRATVFLRDIFCEQKTCYCLNTTFLKRTIPFKLSILMTKYEIWIATVCINLFAGSPYFKHFASMAAAQNGITSNNLLR
jgi:hypothetical protein